MLSSAEPGKARAARILLVDDHALVRDALRELIEQEPDFCVCREVETTAQTMNAIERKRPDLVLLDLSMRKGDGLSLVRSIRSRFPRLPILVLSLHNESIFAERALRAGANGYIMNSEAPDALVPALRQVLAGDVYVGEPVRKALLERIRGGSRRHPSMLAELSDRELEVFQLIGRSLSTREIAESLGLSVKTVETHRAHIKKKLHLADGDRLAEKARDWVDTGTLVYSASSTCSIASSSSRRR